MNDIGMFPKPVGEIAAKGSISDEDVLRLRREVFRDGVVDRVEAEAVFRLNGLCPEKGTAWHEFYVESLTDYLVWKADPPKYVSEENAAFLINHIVSDGRIDGLSELELLINVIHWSESCPEKLVMFVLEAVSDSVLRPEQALYGTGRKPDVIDPVDVEIIRKVIYAGGGGGGFTVTGREAALMFDLNNATVEVENAPSWSDLFVKAVANYLMFPRGAPVVPDASEYNRREAWLDERRGVGGMLMDMGRSLGRMDFLGAMGDLDLFGSRAEREAWEREEARTREALSHEAIDQAEAAWLIEQINKDEIRHENERALMVFIKQNSPQIHPSLNELFDKFGL
jgi:DNA-binding Lrp family transcriptional regulator